MAAGGEIGATTSFDFSSFLIAVILFLFLMLIMTALLRFIHKRFFAPHMLGITAEQQATASRFVVRTNGPIRESYRPPPYYPIHILQDEKIRVFRVTSPICSSPTSDLDVALDC
jgi:hypothetical protein